MIGVITAPRTPYYLPTTLASMFVGDPTARELAPVRIFSDSDDHGYLTDFRHHGSVEIVKTDHPRPIRGVGHRITMAFWCALTSGLDEDELVLIEDDIVCRDGWCVALRQRAKDVEAFAGPRFLLSAYACYDFNRNRYGYCDYPPAAYYGNQMLWIPKAVRHDLAGFIFEHGCEKDEAPGDLLVGRFCREAKVRLFATVPAMCQHIGKVSGSKSPAHWTPMWEWGKG